MVWRVVEDPQRDEGEYTIHGTFTEERDLRGSDNQIIVVVGFFLVFQGGPSGSIE